MYNFNSVFGSASAPSRSIPSNQLAPEFGEVSLRQVGDRLQVIATLAMGAFLLGDGERCVAGLALDASQSMRDGYGRGRTVSAEASREFTAKGMFEETVRDGVVNRILTKEAKELALKNGWDAPTRNIVQEPCVQMIDNLIRTFATGGISSGSCEVIYWACGQDGAEIESLGNIRHDQLTQIRIDGPHTKVFGRHTHLAPPFRHFIERTSDANSVLVFVTDGHIEDEQAVIAETHRLAALIKEGRHPSVKCVLLGIGKKIDREQLDRIDDMEMPPSLEDVDIWNSKVMEEMRDMNDAWSEIFDPETLVGSSLRVFNERSQLIYEKTDEVKAMMAFEVPSDTRLLELVLDGDMKIRQPLV